ncbi:MAG: hypothetical protein NXI21_01150 [Alphaproteobacteria bacterium]|nr:hypothetical protein [Alphaproteobacteria bacterium]
MASEIGAVNASTILAASQRKPGEFKIRTDGSVKLRAMIDQLGAEAGRKQITASALIRLRGIAEGVIDPSSEWETTGGFLQITGQAFKLSLDAQGQIQVEAQAESDLLDYTPGQREQIRAAVDQMKELVAAEDLETTKADLRATLAFGVLRIEEMKRFSPAEEFWETQFQNLAEAGRPVKLSLDADGNLFALDQLTHDFSDVADFRDRQTLLDAQRDLKAILSGAKAATEAWQFEALGNKSEGDDYFLALDADGAVTVERNSVPTVTPEFLAADPDGPETTAPWQQEALSLYRAKKGFHFDFDPSGQTLRVVENTLQNLTQGDEIAAGEEKIRSALVSLLA